MKKFVKGDYTTELVTCVNGDGETVLELNVLATPQLKVDRPDIASWEFNLKQRPIAERLQRCIDAYKAFVGYTVEKDVEGKTYVIEETADGIFFHKQHINNSLKKLGF